MSDNKVFLPPPIITPTVRPTTSGKPSSQEVTPEGKDFAAHLTKAKGLKLSHHARERLSGRQIPFTVETWGRVLTAVEKVAEKGGRDSLVLLGDLALVVNVPNRTIVTAVDGPSMKERVFTNIDSAVIA